MVNGTASGCFQASVRLRQGDPLFPFLFIIGAEVLTKAIDNATENDRLSGIRPSPQSRRLNHLSFADDYLVFAEANMDEIRNLATIFNY